MKRLLLAVALLPLAVHAQSANVVAGLQEDVSSLRDEVRKLREEVAELREANTALANKAATAPAPGAGAADLNARIAAVDTAQTAARKSDRAEILAEVARKNAALEASVDKALADQAARVNAALRSGNAATPPAAKPVAPVAKPVPTTPVATPSDMPKSGVKYRVQSGDSVSRIAKKMNSKAAWILAANGLRSNADLKAHTEIIVPQPDEAPAGEASAK